jgi:hypothetical protein
MGTPLEHLFGGWYRRRSEGCRSGWPDENPFAQVNPLAFAGHAGQRWSEVVTTTITTLCIAWLVQQAIGERAAVGACDGVIAGESLRQVHRFAAPPAGSSLDMLALEVLDLLLVSMAEPALRGGSALSCWHC